ncbi:MAG: riboflavin synthase [Candidatus Omnitrophica bacterium]|nr:riboflavin synthase [Candidatus Omnitrophota bacterium]
MFTGIIEQLGEIKKIESVSNNKRLFIKPASFWQDLQIGESIAVNGVCLTVVDFKKDFFVAEVMPTTLAQTTLGNLKIGEYVNLERALTPNSRLSGHFVTGHIDEMGIISNKQTIKDVVLSIKVSVEAIKRLLPKGSVAVDGISLTIGEIKNREFTVYLISHSLKNTNLQFKNKGDKVNIEIDLLSKAVYKYLRESFFQTRIGIGGGKGVTKEILSRGGFL